jgi:hypothetical protein
MNSPVIGTRSDYLRSLDEINDCILDLEEMQDLLGPNHKKRLRKLVANELDETVFTVDEVEKQFALVRKIRDQLVAADGHLLEDVDVKTISALISSSSSLISLYLKNQAMIDHLKEVATLREAVTHAIKELDRESQTKFFTKFDELVKTNA